MEKQKQIRKSQTTWLFLNVVTAAICLNGSRLSALGVVAPNGENSNQYFQVEETSLYRFDCPEGVVPTGNSCDDNKSLLGNYPRIRKSIDSELQHEIGKLVVAIEGETRSLKESDPEVKAMRQSIRQYGAQSDQIAVTISKTEQHIVAAQNNLTLIAAELNTIAEALKKDPSEEQLKRLLAQQKRYAGLKTRYQSQKKTLELELVAAKESKEGVNDLIQSTNVKLSDYMKALVVNSAALEKLVTAKGLYDRELGLLPELDARVTDKVAYELKLWDDPGAPELFARMLKHVGICKQSNQQ